MDDDAALVARAQGGDRAAFAALVDRHQAVAFRVCYRVLGEREDAADATQEAFLRAYRRLDTFLGQSTFKTWFMRLTVNVALNERARRKDHTSLDEETLLTRPGADDPHDTGLVRAEAAAHLHQALQLLPPNHRAAVVLRDLEEFTYAETAMALGVAGGDSEGLGAPRARAPEGSADVSPHDNVLELLPAYVAGELDAAAQERVTRALVASPRLREELARYRRLFVLLVALAEEEVAPDAGFDRRVMRQIAIRWYLGSAARFLEGVVGAYGRAVLFYLGGGTR